MADGLYVKRSIKIREYRVAAGWVPGNRNGCPRVSGWSRLADGDADVAIDLKIAQFDSHPGQ